MNDRVWESAIAMGLRNRELIELANRHCTHMQFLQEGGQGMAEIASGLPINMRQVRCPVAHGGMASNLTLVVPEFYREHCIGCPIRRPTGQVPNLASYMEEQDLANSRADAAKAAHVAALLEEWSVRCQMRQALAAQLDDVMASALVDVGALDPDPSGARDLAAETAALARIHALAERAPEMFEEVVVAHGNFLVSEGLATPALLDAFRLVSGVRTEFAAQTVSTALAVMRVSSSVPAGRCIADLVAFVHVEDLDEAVCRSFVILAGAPSGDAFRRPSGANDAVGLMSIAGLIPARLERVLRRMLPGPASVSRLVLPPSATTKNDESLFDIASAANAVRILAATHPELAERLVAPMVLQMSSDVFTVSDSHGLADVERSLAVMLVLGVGNIPAAMTSSGAVGSDGLGERLVRIMALAQNLVSSSPRRREPGDPVPSPERAVQVADELFVLATGRLGGDWGGPALAGAADLVEELAKDRPDVALNRLPAILGGALALIETSDEKPPSSLEIVGGDSPTLRALAAETTAVMRRAAIRHLLAGVKAGAEGDPVAVCNALIDAITDERDTERSTDVAWYLMETLGEIGRAHGDLPGVLGQILPVLHTYLVGKDAGLRARALDVWVKIGSRHELPSSLVDLVPVLARDNLVIVTRALLRAATALTWPDRILPQLLLHATSSLNALKNGPYPDGLKEAVRALLTLTTRLQDNNLQLAAQASALAAAEALDSFDLQDVLRANAWGLQASRSAQMARLRFKQAADPQINDRFNQRGAPELTALLDCGTGLLALKAGELAEAALALGPDRPMQAAEFIEVAWRAGRLTDAVAMIDALLAATPDQPAYADRKMLFDVISAVLHVDAAVAGGSEWEGFAEAAMAGAAALGGVRDAGVIKNITEGAVASLTLRRLLMASSPVDPTDPPADLRIRAQALTSAGEALAKVVVQTTATGAYLMGVAALCDVVAHLLLAEAAAFDAQIEQMLAHKVAAERRSELVASALMSALGGDDPLGGPLLGVIEAARSHPAGSSTGPLFEKWRLLPLPLSVVVGPRRAGVASFDAEKRKNANSGAEARPVAVTLLSLDQHLVTGPEVLRRGQVYELSVRVQAGEWPTWAKRLDGELLSHLTPAEITTPTFSWSRAEHVGDGETYEQAGSIVLRFTLAPGASAPPLLMRLIWRGDVKGEARVQSLDVAGHRELRLRPYDETRDRATNYPVFDERLLEMYDRLARAGYDEDQLQAFCRLFTSICRVGLEITWEKKYRRGAKVTEKVFHDDIHNRLIADVELGGRVERGSPLALGFLDVRHDGITAELKVERQSPVTKERAPKYMGQPTQYAAANGARLSILAILDMSPKQVPIGTPENYLFDLIPKLHGLENPEAPSLVAVLVINGNLPTPSSWSRKKTQVQSASSSPGDATSGSGTNGMKPGDNE